MDAAVDFCCWTLVPGGALPSMSRRSLAGGPQSGRRKRTSSLQQRKSCTTAFLRILTPGSCERSEIFVLSVVTQQDDKHRSPDSSGSHRHDRDTASQGEGSGGVGAVLHRNRRNRSANFAGPQWASDRRGLFNAPCSSHLGPSVIFRVPHGKSFRLTFERCGQNGPMRTEAERRRRWIRDKSPAKGRAMPPHPRIMRRSFRSRTAAIRMIGPISRSPFPPTIPPPNGTWKRNGTKE